MMVNLCHCLNYNYIACFGRQQNCLKQTRNTPVDGRNFKLFSSSSDWLRKCHEILKPTAKLLTVAISSCFLLPLIG